MKEVICVGYLVLTFVGYDFTSGYSFSTKGIFFLYIFTFLSSILGYFQKYISYLGTQSRSNKWALDMSLCDAGIPQ